MLGELLRRLLWLPPVVVLVSALTFELVMDGPTTAASPYSHLPRFFNSNPADVTTLARDAVVRLKQGEDGAAAASLSRLGGAALPVVLPELDGLPVPARARLVAALRPVGARVGLQGGGTVDDEVIAWRRFWEERSFDFLAPAVRRAVRRYVQSPTQARLREVQALDSAALDELFAAIGPDGPLPEPSMARAVLPVIQRALGSEPRAGEGNEEVLAARSFWFAHRIEFVALDGPRRAAALLLETQYGKLVQRAVLDRTVEARQGRSPLRLLLRRGRATLGRVVGGVALGAALVWGLLLWRGWVRWIRALGPAAVVACVGALWLASPSVGWTLALFVAASSLLLIERSAARWGLVDERGSVARAALARGLGSWAFALRGLLLRAPSLFFLALGEVFSEALMVVMVAEWRWRIPGLGTVIVDAVRERDATTLVSLSVASAVAVQASLSFSEALAARRDARLEAR